MLSRNARLNAFWNLGIGHARSPEERASYRISNQMTFTSMFLALPFVPFTYQNIMLTLVLLLTVPVFAFSFLLNQQGRHLPARIWLATTTLAFLVFGLAIADDNPVPEYRLAPQVLLMAYVSYPLVLFRLDEGEPLWSLVTACLGVFFSFRWIDQQLNLGPGLPDEVYNGFPIYWVMSAEAFMVLLLSFLYFKRNISFAAEELREVRTLLAEREKYQYDLQTELSVQADRLAASEGQLIEAKAALQHEKELLEQQQQRLKGVQENLDAREQVLETQRKEELLVLRYDRLIRSRLSGTLSDMLHTFLLQLSQEFPLWRAVAWVKHPTDTRLQASGGFGVSDFRLAQMNAQPMPALLKSQVLKRTMLYTDMLPEGQLLLQAGDIVLQARAFMLLPLYTGEQLVGILELVFSDRLTSEQQSMLEKLASTVAVLLQDILLQQPVLASGAVQVS